jgi:hypothetical protein
MKKTMKNAIIIFACVLLLSCGTQKMTLSPFVAAYKREGTGNVLPAYIFLKTQPQMFEIYVPGIYSSSVGQWNIRNDTLFLSPKYEYSERNNELNMNRIISEDSTILSIPQQYIIKKDKIIDVTDYSTILPDYLNVNTTIEMFTRIK